MSFSEICGEKIVEAVVSTTVGMFEKTVGMFENKRKSKLEFKGKLNELNDLEIASNAYVYIPEDTPVLYYSYSSKMQELNSFVNSSEIKLSKKQTSNYNLLREEVNKKLVIYRFAFIKRTDMNSEERRQYYYQYIAPKTTKIQKLISELLNN